MASEQTSSVRTAAEAILMLVLVVLGMVATLVVFVVLTEVAVAILVFVVRLWPCWLPLGIIAFIVMACNERQKSKQLDEIAKRMREDRERRQCATTEQTGDH